jgi:hypothetical protein
MTNGFEKCDECNGTGIHTFPSKNWDHCFKCRGTGRLSWLEKIFKKNMVSLEDCILRTQNMRKYIQEKWEMDFKNGRIN